MHTIKYLILGAGPSGLTLAHALRQRGESSVLVMEKEAVAGGLCRSEIVDGAPLDIGGGHFLDTRRPRVLEFLFQFMPRSEWDSFSRISTIRLRGVEIDYPFEANLWQLPAEAQVDFLESIARAGCVRGLPMPESFAEWITWKLGDRIAEEYMLPYNRKIWSIDLDRLGTYWLHKLPNVSFRDTLRSCLERRPLGDLPGHATFFYPRAHGYGEVWRRMGADLGDGLLLHTPVQTIDVANRVVNGAFRYETLVTTIPWTLWREAASLPAELQAAIGQLEYAAIDVDYHAEDPGSRAHWIYLPDERTAAHRILGRQNFCAGSRGYWTETNARRSAAPAGWRHHNPFAYPLNTRGKPAAVEALQAWSAAHHIVPLGRWGRWEHMNSDVAVDEALAAADRLTPDT
jgi:protoporphyrinogen oxidase